ncbi:peroxisome proliferator-activated receptor gamma coactivator-related protein 1 [Hoplias malabaricus]|uniref:peroxisome proliferator-activated receptor gamma coactivator-related protein 1 n=1 Tax=Hoplias malabaricus TaxID=27720 RepID=UPI00346269BE
MAAPRGEAQRSLNAGFAEVTAPAAAREAQDGFERCPSLVFGNDVDCTSAFHTGLEPSILSFFEDTSAAGEVRNRIDEESEATLLSALSEILDGVIEDTLSPFDTLPDTLPDTDLFVGHRSHDPKFKRSSDKEAAAHTSRSQRSSLTNSKVESLNSDRQLRPRLHQRIQTTVQRSDGEEEDLSETRRLHTRTFRIESDPQLSQDQQQDEYKFGWLADVVRHMHPYSLRVDQVKEERARLAHVMEEEDVFVDVVGDDEGISPSELKVPPPQTSAVASEVSKCKVGLGNVSSNKNQKSVLVQIGCVKVKKKVSFATDLVSVHEYQAEDGESECDWTVTASLEDLNTADCDFSTSTSGENCTEASTKTPPQHSDVKPKSISLQEYRLLRKKSLPKEDRKMDYRTRWPSVPEPPNELTPIPCVPGYDPAQVCPQNTFANARTSTSGSPTKPRRNLPTSVKSPPKQNALQAVDPPNPVIVPLPKPAPFPSNTSSSSSSKEQDMQQKTARNNEPTHMNPQLKTAAAKPTSILKTPKSLTQERQENEAEVPQTLCFSITTNTTKATVSASTLPTRGRPSLTSQRQLPVVQMPTNIRDDHCAEEQSSKSTGEIGIQATDVTSLLEQFETQGLTPPATPPHQIWKTLMPAQKPKQHETIKPSKSPSKAIQIIDPRPLPPSKTHSKPQPSTSVPAPSFSLAFRDHDYCGTQEIQDSRERSLSAIDVHRRSLKEPRSHISHKPSLDHRTFCEDEHLPASVLLSPENSPCRLEESGVSAVEEAKPQRRLRHSSRSFSPPAFRGRRRRRRYPDRHHHRHSESSSVSSSRSSSCSSSASSSSSLSPPRKRLRSRRSESSSSLSSRSSSSSLSPSPIRKQQHRYTRASRSYSRSHSGSHSRSRSRSRSPHSDWRNKWSSWKRHREQYCTSRWEEARWMRKQKAIEERRVVYVGRIHGTMTKDELRDRFSLFGRIEDCTVHLRSQGDNYGFVTYYNTDDAFAAIENGTKLRQPDELPFDICFGGRRQFCQSDYADLDSNRETNSASIPSRCAELDFDTLLKQAQRGVKR